MSRPKRLHPVAIIFNMAKDVKELLFPFVIALIIPGKSIGLAGYIQWMIAGVVCIFFITLAVLKWIRFTYKVEHGELKIESGIFFRKNRYIRFERIHSIDVSEGIIQRLFGLVKVSIETAGGTQAEAVLSAIRKEEAVRLNEQLLEAKRNKTVVELEFREEQSPNKMTTLVYKQTFLELFLMSATSGAVGVILSGMAAFASQFDEMIPFERVFGSSKVMLELGIYVLIGLACIGIILVYIVAIIMMMLKYADFTVEKIGDELVISRGLFEKRQLTIPLKKVQGIRIVESIIRQPLGFATVYLEYAGGSLAEKESLKVMLFPLIKKKKLQENLERFIPNYLSDLSLNHLPSRAYSRYVFRKWLYYAPVIVACIYFLSPWGYTTLLLLPIGCGWAYLQYREVGWNITGSQLTIRSRFVSKQTLLVHKNKIQSIKSSTSWIQNRKQLTTISALVKSGVTFREGEIKDVDAKDFTRIHVWFLTKKSS